MPEKPEVIMNGSEFAGSRSRIPEETRAEVVHLAEQEIGRNEIARRTGISARAVSRIAAAHGLGFSQEQTAQANRARIIQLREKRLDQAEQLHLLADASIALAAQQMIDEPSNHRGRAEALKAVRDAQAAQRDLAAIDGDALERTADLDEAVGAIDQWAIEIREVSGVDPA